MKNYFYSLFIMMFAFTSVNANKLYVATTGVDSIGDGSLANPFATLNKAYTLCASGDTIFVGSGTFTNTGTITFSADITIQGVSAAESIVQMATEPASATNVLNKRMFIPAASAKFILNDLTLQNAGGMNTNNGGGIINATKANSVIEINRCNLLNSIFRYGGAIQINNATASLIINDCYFANNYALSRYSETAYTDPSYGGGAISAFSGTLVIKNTVFYKNGNLDNPLGYATAGTSEFGSCLKIDCNSTIINCTFIDNGSDFSTLAGQSVKIGFQNKAITAKLINNIFIGNTRNGMGDADLYIDPTITIDAKKNVIAYTGGADLTADNTVNNSFTKISPEISVEMDGNVPMIKSTPTGVKYIFANGSEIVQKGIGTSLNADVPLKDIAGSVRNTTPWIGAFEGKTTHLAKPENNSFVKVYSSENKLSIMSVKPINYAVYTIDGKLVNSGKNIAGVKSVAITQSGIYLVKVQSEFGDKTIKVCMP